MKKIIWPTLWLVYMVMSFVSLNCGSTSISGSANGNTPGTTGNTPGTPGTASAWQSLAVGSPTDIERINNQYVMVGNSGMIKSSTDGVTWVDHTSATITTNLNNVAGNGTIYVVTGANGLIYSSTDLVTWTNRVPTGDIATTYNELLWNGTQFLAIVGYYYLANPFTMGSFVSTSSDGINWTTTNLGSLILYIYGSTIWDGTKYLFKTPWTTATIPYTMKSSTDGITWGNPTYVIDDTSTTLDSGDYIQGIEFFKGKYYALVENTAITDTYVLMSSDLVAWTRTLNTGKGGPSNIKATADRLCIAGMFPTNCTADGITWKNYADSNFGTIRAAIGSLNSILSRNGTSMQVNTAP